MAAAPVAVAAEENPIATTLAGSIKDAGLFDTLENTMVDLPIAYTA